MLKKLTIVSVIAIIIYCSLTIFAVDVMKVRQLAARNLLDDISQSLYAAYNNNNKFPDSYIINNNIVEKYKIVGYSYRQIPNNNFELIINIKNVVTKNDVLMANKGGVYILTKKNDWFQVRRGINLKGEKGGGKD
jgi:hypothetical protein